MAFTICFLTGLASHFAQHPVSWFSWPTRPVSLYQFTQGAHVLSGIAAIPLLLAKLWSVYPRLFARPPLRPAARLLTHGLERLSILVLLAAAFFELITGVFNVAQSYPWRFFFPAVHYAVAWVAVGALVVHIGVKLPVIRAALAEPVAAAPPPRPDLSAAPAPTTASAPSAALQPTAGAEPSVGPEPSAALQRNAGPEPSVDPEPSAAPGSSARPASAAQPGAGPEPSVARKLQPAAGPPATSGTQREWATVAASRRAFLRTTAVTAGAAVLATAGVTVPWLRRFSPLAWRSDLGPQGLPVNRTAIAAGIQVGDDWRLEVSWPGGNHSFTLAELSALPQRTATLPIACVEGWSASASWSGIPMMDLLSAVGAPTHRPVRVSSLDKGIYGTSTLPAQHAADPLTLLALRLNGAVLHPDHGYPCRIIAPSRPGVLQTKWVTRLEILT